MGGILWGAHCPYILPEGSDSMNRHSPASFQQLAPNQVKNILLNCGLRHHHPPAWFRVLSNKKYVFNLCAPTRLHSNWSEPRRRLLQKGETQVKNTFLNWFLEPPPPLLRDPHRITLKSYFLPGFKSADFGKFLIKNARCDRQ